MLGEWFKCWDWRAVKEGATKESSKEGGGQKERPRGPRLTRNGNYSEIAISQSI